MCSYNCITVDVEVLRLENGFFLVQFYVIVDLMEKQKNLKKKTPSTYNNINCDSSLDSSQVTVFFIVVDGCLYGKLCH